MLAPAATSGIRLQRIVHVHPGMKLSRDQPFNAPATIKSARFPKNAKTFLFVKCHGRCTDAKWQNLNWASCFTFGRFTQPSKVLHSDGKFIQPNMWTAGPSFTVASSSSSFSIFIFFLLPNSLSSIYKSFPSKLSSLFSSRRSLVI